MMITKPSVLSLPRPFKVFIFATLLTVLLPTLGQAASFSLSMFTRLTAEGAYYYTGQEVEFGDLNGDGYDDLLIGAPLYSSGYGDPTVYIVPGKARRLLPTSSLSFSSVIKLTGEDSSDSTGKNIASGDINADGYEDLFISAYQDDDGGSNAGAAYLVYGKSEGLASMELSSSTAVKFTGENDYDYAGSSVAMGDINGDGYDDLILGAHWNDDGGGTSGAVYIKYGQQEPLSSISLSDTSVVELTGDATDRTGSTLAVGDVNGDGFDDILTGSIRDDFADGVYTPVLYLVYGSESPITSMSLTESTVVRLEGNATEDYFTEPEVTMGDVNGDTYADMLIGVFGDEEGGTNAGVSYLLYGQSSRLSSMSLLDSSVVQFTGEAAYDYSGIGLAMGDVNGDGYDDVLIGASGNDEGASGAGSLYIMFGQSAPLVSTVLSDTNITQLTGVETSEGAGYAIATGDFNNDGKEEILTGAYRNGDIGTYGGAAYLIYGK